MIDTNDKRWLSLKEAQAYVGNCNRLTMLEIARKANALMDFTKEKQRSWFFVDKVKLDSYLATKVAADEPKPLKKKEA